MRVTKVLFYRQRMIESILDQLSASRNLSFSMTVPAAFKILGESCAVILVEKAMIFGKAQLIGFVYVYPGFSCLTKKRS